MRRIGIGIGIMVAVAVLSAAPVVAAGNSSTEDGNRFAESFLDGLEKFGFGEGLEAALAGPTKISVNAEASVRAKPDMAVVRFEVREQAKDAAAAMKKCSKRAEKLMEALADAGADEDGLSIASADAWPDYDYDDPEGTSIKGYSACIEVRADDLDAEDAGGLVAEAMDNGADSVKELKFFCGDYDEEYEKALKKAVKAAEKKAEVVADAADMKIIRMEKLSEGYQGTARYAPRADASTGAASLKAPDADWEVPTDPGYEEITASVSAIFDAQ